jgi:hypothetical protein
VLNIDKIKIRYTITMYMLRCIFQNNVINEKSGLKRTHSIGAVHGPTPTECHTEIKIQPSQDIYTIFPDIVIENKSTSIWRKYSSKKKTEFDHEYIEKELDQSNEINSEYNKENSIQKGVFLAKSDNKEESDMSQTNTIRKENLEMKYNFLDTPGVIAQNKENIVREKNG